MVYNFIVNYLKIIINKYWQVNNLKRRLDDFIRTVLLSMIVDGGVLNVSIGFDRTGVWGFPICTLLLRVLAGSSHGLFQVRPDGMPASAPLPDSGPRLAGRGGFRTSWDSAMFASWLRSSADSRLSAPTQRLTAASYEYKAQKTLWLKARMQYNIRRDRLIYLTITYFCLYNERI